MQGQLRAILLLFNSRQSATVCKAYGARLSTFIAVHPPPQTHTHSPSRTPHTRLVKGAARTRSPLVCAAGQTPRTPGIQRDTYNHSRHPLGSWRPMTFRKVWSCGSVCCKPRVLVQTYFTIPLDDV